MVQPRSSMDARTAWKNFRFILSQKSDVRIVGNLSIALDALFMCVLTSLSIDEILLPNYVNWSTNFRGLPFNELAPS